MGINRIKILKIKLIAVCGPYLDPVDTKKIIKISWNVLNN